jgi:hypothetical protein
MMLYFPACSTSPDGGRAGSSICIIFGGQVRALGLVVADGR